MPPLISSLLFLILALFILLKKKIKNSLIFIFSLNCFIVFWWQFSWFLLFNTKDEIVVSLLAKIGYSGIIFIPVTFLHFTLRFLDIARYQRALILQYTVAFILLISVWFSDLLISGYYQYQWGYYPKAGIFHPIFLSYFLIMDIACLLILYKKGSSIKWFGDFGNSIKYLFIGLLIFSLAGIDFISNYGFSLYPIGVLFTFLYLFIEAYAIIKHRFIDIKIVVTRISIFTFVYALILGTTYWLGFQLLGFGVWIIPVSLMAVLATVGPFIYLYLQKRAEDRLLVEQRRYQATLRQASTGMGRIKDLNKLLNMIAYVLIRSVRIDHAVIYIKNSSAKKFVIGAMKRRVEGGEVPREIPYFSSMESYLLKHKEPIILEEMERLVLEQEDAQLQSVHELMISLDAAVVFPIFIGTEIAALVVMGRKENRLPYTEEDLAVFSILGNQAALAIENAKFNEDMKITQEQLFQAEKMATIGTMADGLSHQINNRFHALGFIAGDAIDTINMARVENDHEKLKSMINDLDNSLKRIQENIVQGGEIVQGLLKYTRKGDAAFTAVDIDAVLKSAIEMTQFKIKAHELTIVREYDSTLIPKVRGNFTQLQEVMFNIIDNAYDAMMQRKNEFNEPNYQPTLSVAVIDEGDTVQIIFKDNGVGIKEADFQKIFTPFFTTKLSSKKGTGLGLYVIRKIIEDNHSGRVECSSLFMQGAQMKIFLPKASA